MSADSVQIPGYIAGTWEIDPVHTYIGFTARHLMVSKVRGNFAQVEGQIITGDDPLKSSAMLTIEMNSVDTGNAQRDSDIKGEILFDVANHPTMTFQSSGVRSKGDNFIAAGQLTIKGITRPVELEVEVNGFGPDPFGGTRAGFSATGEIDRTEFGMNPNLTLPTGGVVISEKIQLTIEIEAVLKTD